MEDLSKENIRLRKKIRFLQKEKYSLINSSRAYLNDLAEKTYELEDARNEIAYYELQEDFNNTRIEELNSTVETLEEQDYKNRKVIKSLQSKVASLTNTVKQLKENTSKKKKENKELQKQLQNQRIKAKEVDNLQELVEIFEAQCVELNGSNFKLLLEKNYWWSQAKKAKATIDRLERENEDLREGKEEMEAKFESEAANYSTEILELRNELERMRPNKKDSENNVLLNASSSRLQQPQCDEKINVESDEKHDPTESPDNASFFLVKPLSYEEKMQKLNEARVMKKKKRSTNRHKSNKRKDTKQGSQATANTKTNGLINTPAPVELVDQQETMEIASPIDRDIPGMSVIEAQPKDLAIDTPVLWMDIKENVNLIPIHTPSKLTRKRRSSEIYIPHKAVSKRPCSFKIQTKQFYDLQPRFLSRFYKLYIQMKYKDKYSTEKKRNQELNLLNTAQEKEISRLKKLFGEAIMRSPPRLIDIHELLLKRLPADRSYAPGFSHLLCVTVRFTGEDPIDLIAIFKEWKKRADDSCIDTIPWNWRALFDLLRQQFHCPIISREISIQSWVDNIESDLTEKGLTALAVPRCHRCEEEYYVQYDGGGRYTEAVECSQAMSDTFVPTVTPTMTDEI